MTETFLIDIFIHISDFGNLILTRKRVIKPDDVINC